MLRRGRLSAGSLGENDEPLASMQAFAVTSVDDPRDEDTYMDDRPAHPDSNGNNRNDRGMVPDRGSPPPAPRWVKVSGIIVLLLVLVLVILHVTGNGFGAAHGR